MITIRDLTHIIWIESWVKVYHQYDENEVVFEGYMGDMLESLYDEHVSCIVPCYDYTPFIGIELVD